jgi:ABC-type antimicrobial peptide transport system permease subunit
MSNFICAILETVCFVFLLLFNIAFGKSWYIIALGVVLIIMSIGNCIFSYIDYKNNKKRW